MKRRGEVGEDYLLKHAWPLYLDRKTRKESEKIVRGIFIREFIAFAEKKSLETLVTIDISKRSRPLVRNPGEVGDQLYTHVKTSPGPNGYSTKRL
jgi:hypothetical protein